MKKTITILLLISVSIFTFFALAASDNTMNKQPAISGIVTDTNGIPIKGVEVTAQNRSMGNNLYRLVCPSTWTDENGYFNLPVDFPDLSYHVIFRYMYNNTCEMNIIPEETEPLKVKLEIKTKNIVRGVAVTGTDSTPVAGAAVKYFGEYQNSILEVRTDNNGQFKFTQLPTYAYWGLIYAQFNDKISPVLKVRDRDNKVPENLVLKLDSGAELWGKAKTENADKPIPNCTISVNITNMSGYSIQTTTDANGLYRFHNIPPAKYQISAQNEDYFLYKKHPFSSDYEITLNSGQKVQKDFKLKKRMRFKGKVVDINGKPVEGAIVAINEARSPDKNCSPFVVRTDSKGKFSITTGYIDTTPKPDLKGLEALKQIIKDAITKRPVGEEAIEAFDSKAGYGKFQFSPYREGDVVKGIKIVLNGYIRIYGKVTDTKGNPLDKVNISATTGPDTLSSTDEQGRYDLGKLPIYHSQIKQGTITFFAPRPGGTSHYPGENQWINDINNHAEKTGFFHHHQETYNITPGKDIEINVSLEPTGLMTLYGTVTDSDNVQVENKDIYLFGGNEAPNTWFKKLNLNGILGINDNAPLRIEPIIHVTKTDTKGYWKIILARETAADLKITHHRDLEPGHFSIGVYKNNNEHTLIQDIVIDPNETQKEINIKLEKDK